MGGLGYGGEVTVVIHDGPHLVIVVIHTEITHPELSRLLGIRTANGGRAGKVGIVAHIEADDAGFFQAERVAAVDPQVFEVVPIRKVTLDRIHPLIIDTGEVIPELI